MKKLIFISLLVIPFCKAADPDQSWHQAVKRPPNLDWQQQDSLILDRKRIETIPNNLNLPNLWQLNLNNNLITAIPGNLNLPRLRSFSLCNNQITSIPDNLNLPNLCSFYLSNNRITSIPDNLNLPRLEHLNLEGNHIDFVSDNIFKQFPNLIFLWLNKNPLTQKNVDQLREAATKTHPKLKIIADNIGVQYKKPPDFIEITLPKDNPTNLSTVPINLKESETFTLESFQTLVDETGTRNFVVVFTTDVNKKKWYPHIFDGSSYESYSKTQGDVIANPVNRQTIQYTLPITIKKEGNQYKYEIY